MIAKLRRMKECASRLYADGRLQEALELYERVVQEDPLALGCRTTIGDLLGRLGHSSSAVEQYEQVAHVYAEYGMLLKAIAVCKQILKLNPDHTHTQLMLADLYARRKGSVPQVPALPVAPAAGMGTNGRRTLETTEPRADEELDVVLQAWPRSDPFTEDVPKLSAPSDEAEVDSDEDVSTSEGLPSLPSIPLFSELPKKAFLEMLLRMPMHELRRGQVVITEGDNGDSLYVIASGIVSVRQRNRDGDMVLLTNLGEGAFFGEMALLQDGVRTATVQVEDDAKIFELSRELLEDLIGHYPTVATAVRNFYRQRLLATAMATHPLFLPFSLEARRVLMEQFKSRSFAEGEVILEEAKRGSGLYLLLHGRVLVSKVVADEEIVLAELKPGDLFGEISLLTNTPISATITAMEEAFVLRLSKKRFDELVLGNDVVLELVGRLAEMRQEETELVVANQLNAHGAILL
ncbi:MAG: cyclic nucleotide-binding domain-containing protein [Myxococcales bacterium]|nr:cyclic nucleotide-binding domain-containing protein [Myxococcales bacterium]